MIKNIVFFVESPLSKRDFDRFGIQILRNEGFDVNIWYFKPYSLNRFHSIPEIQDLVHDDRLQIFERKSDVLKCISVLKDSDLVVCLLSFDYHNLFVYQALSRKRSWYCVWQAVSLPVSINTDIPSGFFFRKILKKIGEMKIRTIHYHFMTNLLKKHYRLLGVRPASIALLAGQRSDDVHFYPIGVNTKKIWLHLLDYDIYLKYREEGPDLTLGRYAVFLDEYIPFHPDYQSMGVEPPASADEYYPKLCTFFEFIEKKFDLRVIVAAHPRSNYDLTKKYFGDRQVIKGKTDSTCQRFCIRNCTCEYFCRFCGFIQKASYVYYNGSNFLSADGSVSIWGVHLHNGSSIPESSRYY